MADQKLDREILDIENLEIKQKIFNEIDIEESIKKLKIIDEDLEKEFQCSICFNFAHEPINCIHCDFKACIKCFDE